MYAVAIDLDAAKLGQFIAGPFLDYTAAVGWLDDGSLMVIWDMENNCEARPVALEYSKEQRDLDIRSTTRPVLMAGNTYLFKDGIYRVYDGTDHDTGQHVFSQDNPRRLRFVGDSSLHEQVNEFIEWDKANPLPVAEAEDKAPVTGGIVGQLRAMAEAVMAPAPDAVTQSELADALKGMDLINGDWTKSEYSYEELADLIFCNIKLARRKPKARS